MTSKKPSDDTPLIAKAEETIRKIRKEANGARDAVNFQEDIIKKLQADLENARKGTKIWCQLAEKRKKEILELQRKLEEKEKLIGFYKRAFLEASASLRADTTLKEMPAIKEED